jgi:hypothetical protein
VAETAIVRAKSGKSAVIFGQTGVEEWSDAKNRDQITIGTIIAGII